LFLFEKG